MSHRMPYVGKSPHDCEAYYVQKLAPLMVFVLLDRHTYELDYSSNIVKGLQALY